MLTSHRPNLRRRLTAFLPLALLLLAGAATVQAQTVIDHLPYVITTKGLYVLNQDLKSSQTSGNLIEVKASNVTLDFQGHFISGPVGVTSQTVYGIRATEQSNLTIKNGTIAYCYEGIFLDGNNGSNSNAVGALVENMRVTYCYFIGISVEYCPAGRITNCSVSQIGYSGTNYAYGIDGYGSGTLMQGNVVSQVTASTSSAYGIYATGSIARQNAVTNSYYGVYGGKYQDNLTLGCTTAVSGGTDAGGNN